MKLELHKPELPASARRDCARPVTIPDRDVTAAETTSLWGRDRASLRECETRRAAAVAAVDGVEP